MPSFVPGLKLSERFYNEIVGPLISSRFPEVKYSAGLIGPGSEVLRFDSPRSTDHHWGPRVQVFLESKDYKANGKEMDKVFRNQLPHHFLGYSTNFGTPDDKGVQLPRPIASGPVNHRVEISTITSFFESDLGVDPNKPLRPRDWLTIPQQRLLEVTTGKVFRDDHGRLGKIRKKLSYYPRDIWLYLLAAQWRRISDEEAFVGRAGEGGDDLGSRVIASRLVDELMKLCFLIERHYAPYTKWLGTAFVHLSCAKNLLPLLEEVVEAKSWQDREKSMSIAYSMVAEMHNALKITKPLGVKVSTYYHRPYLVIHGERFAQAIRNAILDPGIRNMKFSAGSVDQFVNSVEIATKPILYRKLRILYDL